MVKQQRKTYTVKTLSDVIEKAREVFDGDKDKAYQWYLTKNPAYGDLSPYNLCMMGKTAKVFKDLTRALI
jgi:hypothetical protein